MKESQRIKKLLTDRINEGKKGLSEIKTCVKRLDRILLDCRRAQEDHEPN